MAQDYPIDYYCEKHEMKTPMHEDTGDPHCPKCRAERKTYHEAHPTY